jgi:hypothetical protein
VTKKPDYIYEHVDGTLHRKPFIVVDMGGGPIEYFDSPFVKDWWIEKPQIDKEEK